jgi:hypothetical protein
MESGSQECRCYLNGHWADVECGKRKPGCISVTAPLVIAGQAFAVIVFAVAAAEVAVGLALIISIYRRRNTVVAEDIDLLKF